MAAKKTVDRSTLPPTFDRLKAKKPIEQRETVFLDDETIAAFDAAKAAIEQAKTKADVARRLIEANAPNATVKARALAKLDADHRAELAKLETARDQAEQAVRDSSVECLFRSIGRLDYDGLLTEHPPTAEDVAEAEAKGEPRPGYHVETFAPALIAASCVSPSMTAEQAAELYDEWNTNEVLQLWVAALTVNNRRRVVELGKGHG